MNIENILQSYDPGQLTIITLGSHSALEICRGAKNLGFPTLVVSEKGRERTYDSIYKTNGDFGCVDDCMILDKFADILDPAVTQQLRDRNAIFVPHRSFEVYINDYDAIENKFLVPIFGNRRLLRFEERNEKPNQYDLLARANIRMPRIFESAQDIDRPVLIKAQEKERGFERSFIIVDSAESYYKKRDEGLAAGIFTQKQFEEAVIEELIIGPYINLNFFYSAVNDRLELIGTDTRRQTNRDGLTNLTAGQQSLLSANFPVKFEEAGHIAATILESQIEEAYRIGEKFVEVTKNIIPPGVIGPFTLQTAILPGPPKKEFVVFDVSLRMPGSPGIWATPYSGYFYGHSVSMGERVAMEIKYAVASDKLSYILT